MVLHLRMHIVILHQTVIIQVMYVPNSTGALFNRLLADFQRFFIENMSDYIGMVLKSHKMVGKAHSGIKL